MRQEMENQVQDLLGKGIINRDSDSSCSSPAIMTPKKSLDGKQKWRMCIDFRTLYTVTEF
jgi:hypothetical protein